MRLHRLELEAFGPFAAPQVIDFDRLAGGGLFLLEGPTGAGKSTILDAITFALYGGLAGADSGHDRTHSGFAGPDAEPSVSLEFSLRGVRYLITRVPEYRRRKRRGEGFTTQPMRVHLRRRDGARWTSLSSNKAEVGDAIDDLVGLSRAQFTQVMLLPQGEFARFLRADDDARRDVLTQLFGTELYDDITAELDHRQSEALRDRRAAAAEIDLAASAAAEAAGLDLDARAALLGLGADELAVRFKQLGDEQAEAEALAAESAAVAAAELEAAESAERAAADLAALMTRLIAARAALTEHEATREPRELAARRLDAARRAEPVRPLLAALADARAEVADAREAVGHARAGPELGDPALARAAGDQAAARAEAAASEASGLSELVHSEEAVAARESAARELDAAAARATAEVESLVAARQALPGRIAAAQIELDQARAGAADLDAAARRRAELARVGAAAGRLTELEPELAALAGALRAATDEHQRLVDEHQAAMDRRLAGMAAELAAGLARGGACPVCGSAEHPAPAAPVAAPVTAAAVAAAREARDAAARARERAEQRHAAMDREAATYAAVAAGATPGSVARETEAVDARLARAEQAAEALARLEPELTGLRAEQDRLGDDLERAREEAVTVTGLARQAGSDLAALRADLKLAAGTYPSVAVRQAALRAAAETHRRLAAGIARLAGTLEAAGRAAARAEAEATAGGFATLELARAAVLAPAEQEAAEAGVRAWDERLSALRAAAEAPELASLDAGRSGEAHAAVQRAASDLAIARAAADKAKVELAGSQDRGERLARRLDEVRDAQDRAQALTEATAPVIYLAGLAKGTEGHRRVALTTYVLRHWFEQVVAAANVRLAVMSSGRYELRRSDEGASRRQRTGLTLMVVDRHTGEERSPRSLSGGETFYTSLALALGLADVVKAEAGGVDLETLFIDEGFGSLDEQTLDQVLGVIDDLRDRGRAVGIVSHVADLKDRVTERLEIRRLPDGSSTARVVA